MKSDGCGCWGIGKVQRSRLPSDVRSCRVACSITTPNRRRAATALLGPNVGNRGRTAGPIHAPAGRTGSYGTAGRPVRSDQRLRARRTERDLFATVLRLDPPVFALASVQPVEEDESLVGGQPDRD